MNVKKIVVTGAKGQLGSAFAQLSTPDYQWRCFDKTALDIRESTCIQRVLDLEMPVAVINAAAYTKVDHAEDASEEALVVNAIGVKYLAAACADRKIPLIHFSTDYVFSGTKSRPYQCVDPVDPVNVYGKTKAAGEAEARAWSRSLILRVSGVFGSVGHNFVKTIAHRVHDGHPLRVVNDQWVCPTPASAIANAVLQLLPRLLNEPNFPFGTYHFCGTPPVTWYGFARAIVDTMGYPEISIEAIDSSVWPSAAIRPVHALLDCQSSVEILDLVLPHWQIALRDMFAEPINFVE